MLLKFWAAIVLSGATALAADISATSAVTFNKDVLPILQANCQSCHRPGQIAPMSFLTYESTRPWAKAMKAAAATRKMPPWFADPQYGHFANARTLKQSDIDTIAKWADTGAVQGYPKDAPPPVQWPPDGWQIKPDIVVNVPEFKVPAKGIVEWTDITIPGPFTKDTWVTSVEVRPDHASVTHHIGVLFRPHTADVVYNVPEWIDKKRDETGSELPRPKGQRQPQLSQGLGTTGIEASYVPGMSFPDYRSYRAGKLVKAGTDLVVQVHYTPNGSEIVDHPQIGFTVAKEEPERHYISYAISSPNDADTFAIPPNQGNWESPIAEATFQEDAEFIWLSPHMHVRGKDMTYRLEYPDGRKEIILNVPRYDFNWQLGYDLAQPIKAPKGTRLVVTAHFDNSVNNKFNPDPSRTVYYGNQTWEEMMMPFFAVTVDKKADPKKVLVGPGPVIGGL